MIGDAAENFAQVKFRVEAVELGCLDQRVHGGGALAALIGAREEIILAAEGERAGSRARPRCC
jgi:hypothetical protein